MSLLCKHSAIRLPSPGQQNYIIARITREIFKWALDICRSYVRYIFILQYIINAGHVAWYLLVYSTCANRPSIYFGAGKSAKMTPSGKTTAWVIQANPADQTELRACSIRDDSAFLERLSQRSCGLRSCTENCWVSQQLERYERDRISYAGEARFKQDQTSTLRSSGMDNTA